jgi:cytoskeletal protein RodZ
VSSGTGGTNPPHSPAEPPPENSSNWPRRMWGRFRTWPLWLQILVGLLVLRVIVGPFIEEDEPESGSTSAANTTSTERRTTTTSARTATTERDTTTTGRPTTTQSPTTTTAEPQTTTFPDDGNLTITAEDADPWPFTVPEGELACADDAVPSRSTAPSTRSTASLANRRRPAKTG